MKKSTHGFALIEMVAVIGMMAVLILLIAATLWGAIKVERADSAAFHRMTVQAQLADQFREDTHHAIACPDSFQGIIAGPQCLVFQMGDEVHVAYRWAEQRLTRTRFVGATQETNYLSAGGDRIAVQFGRVDTGVPIVWMRLVESRGASSSRRDWPVEIHAAIGGDVP